MKKYLIVLALTLPLITFAQTTSSTADLQIIINKLQTQIQLLQAKVADLQAQMQSVNTELKFSRVLTQGATGNDVKQLQEFLKTYTGAYPDGLVTGYYGPLTAVAVKNFQQQNGIDSIGIVGPKTQDKLNVLVAAIPNTTVTTPSGTYAGQTSPALPISQTTTVSTSPPTPSAVPFLVTGIPAPPTTRAVSTTGATPCKTPTSVQVDSTSIKVLSPNGGEQWQMGEFQTMKYSAKNLGGNKALLIYLNKGYNAPTTKTGVNSSQLIGVTTNLESYTYKLNQILPAGNNYSITIMAEGSYSSCDAISYIGDSSDATFSIVAGQDNSPTNIPTTSTITTTQDKIASILAQISALQSQLDTTTDDTKRVSLTAQIISLKTIVQELQNQISQGQLLPVFVPSQVNTRSQEDMLPTQDRITAILGHINDIQNKLNITTDDVARDSLMKEVIRLKSQIQMLQSLPTTTSQSPPTTTTGGGYYQAQTSGQTSPAITSTIMTTQEKIASIQAQISNLQNQLNNTIDDTKRASLTIQINGWQAVIQQIQNQTSQGQLLPTTTPSPVPVIYTSSTTITTSP